MTQHDDTRVLERTARLPDLGIGDAVAGEAPRAGVAGSLPAGEAGARSLLAKPVGLARACLARLGRAIFDADEDCLRL
jgi:hypothetical protein